jgi:ureidoacrylate peracid hydrolase
MHKVTLPEELRQRLEQRRGAGRRHIFDTIEAKNTALLVVDMQNFFLDAIETARGIVPNINRLAVALRDAGGLVVWIRASHSESGRAAWTLFFDNFLTPEMGAEARRRLSPGHSAHELFDELDIQAEDPIVDKDRFSAFIQGASNLEATLRSHDIDTVLVVGTNTNVCCESTARDAMMRDFKTFMVEDANAAIDDQEHIDGLRTFVQVFGDVITTEDALKLIAGP